MGLVKLGPEIIKQGSTIWDEAGNTEIVQILISHNNSGIKSIQFVYAEKSGVHHSLMYGRHNGLNFNSVLLDYPSEQLTSVSGKYSESNLNGMLTSITFGTNKRKYGPFGMPVAHPIFSFQNSHSIRDFNYEFGATEFGGFHGCFCNNCICTIGVYVKLLGAPKPPKK